MNLQPHTAAVTPVDREMREIRTTAGVMWQYTRVDGPFVTYWYGMTPEEAMAAAKDTPHD